MLNQKTNTTCNNKEKKKGRLRVTYQNIVFIFSAIKNIFKFTSSSAEFLPGIKYSAGATSTGPKGGTQVCLSIFSDFAEFHPEWANEKGTGWSPSYTAQV